MTREEAISILHGIRADNLNFDDLYTKDKYNALSMAIKALEQEPCGDAIDRKLVCAFIDGLISDDGEREKGLKYIRSMPPVNPQPCKDAIDRAEAIKIASGYCHPANVAKELAKLPPVNPQPCEDAISRENAIIRISWDFPTLEISKVKESLDKLPSVTPQPKTGHWIRWYEQKEHDRCTEYIPHCKCSECGKEYDSYSSQFIKYCNECGAKMIEPQESEE